MRYALSFYETYGRDMRYRSTQHTGLVSMRQSLFCHTSTSTKGHFINNSRTGVNNQGLILIFVIFADQILDNLMWWS